MGKLEKRLEIRLQSARERLQHLAKYEIGAFTYNEEDLLAIRKAFARLWVAPLVNVLTKLDPYAELIAMRSDDGSLLIQFQEWFRLYEAKSKEGQFEGNAMRLTTNSCFKRQRTNIRQWRRPTS